MAYDYQKAKSAYEKLSKDEQQQFIDRNSDNANVQQFAKDYAAEMSGKGSTPTVNSTVNKTTTSTSSNVAKPEYQGTGGSNKQSPYTNQGEGNYTYNPTSSYYEKSNTSQTSNQTSSSSKPVSSDMSSTKNSWDNMSYEDQQKKLNEIPGLKDALVRKGWNIKTEEVTPTKTETGGETPKTGDEWDYQDNSPERMAQMADNVNKIYATNPGIFSNEDTFRMFFIDGKGRTPEQEQFLMDYYKNMQTYNKFDGYSADALGSMYAYGKVPESYLNYVKNSNPDRYNAIMDAKDKEQDKISNKSYYNAQLEQAGFESSDTTNLAWQKKEGLLVDENGDLIDDRRYHEPSEEEKTMVNRANEIVARRLEIKNIRKNLEKDLTAAYPGATRATIVALVNDRMSELQLEDDDLAVELAQLQGQISYEQNERQQMDNAGADTIAQLQKNLGMYYDYTPEGMSELAQAKYAATNVTLDQADNGTDTQKQMALQSVLDDYYDKYGSIIQRSEQQVINDVMAYAKKNGVSLSQALEENFLKPLRSKPEFSQLNTLQSDPYTVKSGDITYVYDPVTKTFSPIGGGTIGDYFGGGTSNGQLYGFTNYTPITTEKKESVLNNFKNTRTEGSDGGQCGEFVNDYLEALGYDRLYDDPIDKKKAVTNSDTATVGSIAVMDSKKYPEYGHVAIVTDVQGDKVKLLESNWNDDKKVHTTRWVNKSDILGYFDPSKEPKQTTTTDLLNAKFGGTGPDWNKNGYFDSMKPLLEKFLEEGKIDSTDAKYSDLKNSYNITDQEFNQMAQNYARTEGKANELESASSALEAAINLYEYINGNKSKTVGFNDPKQDGIFDWMGGYVPKLGGDAYDAKNYYDTLMSNLTLDKLIETKKQGATYGAMSEGEWNLLKSAATSLDWGSTGAKFKENLENMIYGMVRAIEEGGGKLPSNYAGSTASKEYLQWQKYGRYDKYKSEGGNKGGQNDGEPEML